MVRYVACAGGVAEETLDLAECVPFFFTDAPSLNQGSQNVG